MSYGIVLALLLGTSLVLVDGTTLNLTVVPQSVADAHGAKCLDGSPPAFYSLIQDPSRFIIFLEGGGWCWSVGDCADRATNGAGSSRGIGPTLNVGGLLSPDPAVNPDFYNWSFVFVHYCDGSSFSSNATDPVSTSTTPPSIWLRGRPNLHAVIAHLQAAVGLGAAKEVILSGGSAGAFAAFLALDEVRTLLPSSVRLVGAPDAGFFVDSPLWNNPSAFVFRDNFIAAETFWNTTGAGTPNSDCLAAYSSEKWKCFFPQYAAPYIQTPWHIMMSAYDLYSFPNIYDLPCIPPACNASELLSLQYWRFQQLGAMVPSLQSYPDNGCFVDSCLVHEQNVDYCSGQTLPNCRGWNLYNVSAPNFPKNLTPQQGFSLWYANTQARWETVQVARSQWRLRIQETLHLGSQAYPVRTDDELRDMQAAAIQIIDPLEFPNNSACPFGTSFF